MAAVFPVGIQFLAEGFKGLAYEGPLGIGKEGAASRTHVRNVPNVRLRLTWASGLMPAMRPVPPLRGGCRWPFACPFPLTAFRVRASAQGASRKLPRGDELAWANR